MNVSVRVPELGVKMARLICFKTVKFGLLSCELIFLI